MKIFLLADLDSPHTVKWATALSHRGHQIFLFGIHACTTDVYMSQRQIIVMSGGNFPRGEKEGAFRKLFYLKTLPALNRAISDFSPAVVHAHYATSYGFLAALSGCRPFLLSVWGSDVDSFPSKSWLNRFYLRWILTRADRILATSEHLAGQVQRLASISASVVPFGIDPALFKPAKKMNSPSTFTFGTAKNFLPFSGIETVIRAFGQLRTKFPGKPLRLLIAGKGPGQEKLEHLIHSLALYDLVEFIGPVALSRMPAFFNRLSAYINVPDRESFGVAVLEAMATELPVIVSNVGGLQEIVKHGETGFLVPPGDPKLLAVHMEQLLLSADLCRTLGQKGRRYVIKYYDWERCVDRMEEIYLQTVYSPLAKKQRKR